MANQLDISVNVSYEVLYAWSVAVVPLLPYDIPNLKEQG